MKKILISAVIFIATIFITMTTIGAKMNAEPTQVRASHILVQSEEQAKAIKNKIKNGETSFEAAAIKYSKCPSGKRGGDLGYFGRKQMVKEFEDAAFVAEKNEITNPVKTQFGWHLIKVTDKK